MMKMSPVLALSLLLVIFPAGAVWSGGVPAVGGRFVSGTPWQGEPGIHETVGEIMRREKVSRPVSGRPNRVIPFRTNPNRKNNPQDPDSRIISGSVPPEMPQTSGAIRSPAPFTPQIISGINFTGATLTDTGAYPPDSMGTVGPTQYILAVNGRVRSFNKNTGVADGVLDVNTDTFFDSVMTPPVASNFTTDPRIRYDRLSGRWFITMIDVPGGASALPNRVMIAVSDSGTIGNSTVWTFFYFEHDLVSPAGDSGMFADYPTLGIDVNALYIGVNIFTASGSFSNATGFVVRKSSVLGPGPIVVTAFRDLITTDGPFTPQGADNYDPTSTEGYFIGVSNAFFGRLVLRRVSDPGGTPGISGNISVTVDNTYFPINVPQQGSSSTLDALDDRLFAAHMRNGNLWTAHNIDVDSNGIATNKNAPAGGRDGTRWYELTNIASPGTPSVVQSGTVYDPAASNPRFYWIPSIMVSGQGHAALGFSTSGNNEHANAATVGRLFGDPFGTTGEPALYTNSATVYNPSDGSTPHRWGDYSYTSLDPDDDMTIWTIQEFCNATNSYGVRVVKLFAPPPATPSSASPSSVSPGQSSVNVTVTGTSVSGSEFFDPGPGFLNHISASLPGVTVNNVTYADPTHVTLDISTVGATEGAKNVTVTNPDGQSATSSSAILTVACPAITVGPVTLTSASYNTFYSQTFNASGGTAPYSFGLSGALPGGMNFSGATLSGSPSAAGDFPFTITSTDSNGCTGSRDYTLAVVMYTARVVETVTDYPSIQAAYNSDADGSVITVRILAADLAEVLVFGSPVTVTLDGGYNADFTNVVGSTSISGSLTVGLGAVTVDNIIIH